MAEYRLNTLWRIDAPQRLVFDVVFDSLRWPQWWPGADRVEEIASGDNNGIGSVRRYVWKGRLPYRLCFDACATRLEPPWLLEAAVTGDLEGIGRWIFSHDDGITSIQYEWHVRTTKHWMNLLAPLGHGILANNHNAIMNAGAEALAQRLKVRLVESRTVTGTELTRQCRVDYQ